MNSSEIENGIRHIYNNDKYLAKVIDISEPCNIYPKKNYFNAVLRSIIGQQLSPNVSQKINIRFLEYFNNRPTPELILNADENDLRGLGLSWAKIKYVKDFSFKLINKEISLKGISNKNDGDIIEMLTVVKGIGVWTVHMLLVFTLGRVNVLPVGDFALRKAAKNIYGLKKIPDEKKIVRLSKQYNWEPYNSVASWYLWKSLELKNNEPQP